MVTSSILRYSPLTYNVSMDGIHGLSGEYQVVGSKASITSSVCPSSYSLLIPISREQKRRWTDVPDSPTRPHTILTQLQMDYGTRIVVGYSENLLIQE